MADSNAHSGDSNMEEVKGKGKAVDDNTPRDDAVDDNDEDSSSSEEENDEAAAPAEEEEDGMEEIDLNNIVDGGRRTRGTKIDFAKAAAENPADDDEDEDDDDDFQPPDEDVKMSD